MHTMYEFSMVTQTWEYVVAAAALILFAPFWKWLDRPVGLRKDVSAKITGEPS